ncbi:MAG TPA: adenylyl-sulfate kinase [Vicinamibacterales bacterium]|nr:adenylyl-sulfate kinase [Vicinamibacterales bacterium]
MPQRPTSPPGCGVTVFFTGLPASGKTTLARALSARLTTLCDREVAVLDGDVIRAATPGALGFSRPDRDRNVRRVGELAARITQEGGTAICAVIAPYEATRAEVRDLVERVGRFVLVHVSTPLEVCEVRDPKGLYAKARAGDITHFTGVSDPYEQPLDADVVIDTSVVTPDEAVAVILRHLESPQARPPR